MITTASSLNTYTQCPRRYEYTYIKERIPNEDPAALLVGSAVHIGCESFWLKDTYARAWERIATYMRESDFWTTDRGRIETAKIRAYVSGYYRNREHMLSTYEVVAVEREWEKTVGGVQFAGKIDLVLRDTKGRLILVDHKTSASSDVDKPGSSFWRQLNYDTQMILYREALSEIAESSAPPVLVYDVIRKTKSKPSQKKKIAKRKAETVLEYEFRKEKNTETIKEYISRIHTTYQRDDTRYIWREIPITKDEASQKVDEIVQIARMMGQKHIAYPRFQNSCISRWGPCPYFDVCCGMDSLESSKFKDKQAHSELNQGEKNGKQV